MDTITHERYPRQSDDLHNMVEVVFNYDTSHILRGIIVRDDVEHPHETIIRLHDGRYIRGMECQYDIVTNNI